MSGSTANDFVLEFVPTDNDFYMAEEEEEEGEDENGVLFCRNVKAAVGTDEGKFIGSGTKGQATISAKIRKAQQGILEQQPATLLIFDFTFYPPTEKKYRFKHACIDIAFESVSVRTAPEIKQWCPDHVIGDDSSTTYSRSNSSLFSLGKQEVASASLGVTHTVERQGVTRFEWRANPRGDPRTGHYHSISWRLSENENNKQGIPQNIPVALIVRNHGHFIARISAEAKVTGSLNPTYWRGMSTKKHAVTIRTDTTIGDKIEGLIFDVLSLDALVVLPENV